MRGSGRDALAGLPFKCISLGCDHFAGFPSFRVEAAFRGCEKSRRPRLQLEGGEFSLASLDARDARQIQRRM